MEKTERTRKVVIVGPECTGKSELSAYLAQQFNTLWVEEYARAYIETLGRPYREDDLLAIARGQLASEDALIDRANRVLICDTDLYVIKIWSLFKYGHCDPWILDTIATRPYDLYLLTDIDIPWIADPQREHPDQRDTLFKLYLREMKQQSVPFVHIHGPRAQRQKLAVDAVHALLEGRAVKK